MLPQWLWTLGDEFVVVGESDDETPRSLSDRLFLTCWKWIFERTTSCARGAISRRLIAVGGGFPALFSREENYEPAVVLAGFDFSVGAWPSGSEGQLCVWFRQEYRSSHSVESHGAESGRSASCTPKQEKGNGGYLPHPENSHDYLLILLCPFLSCPVSFWVTSGVDWGWVGFRCKELWVRRMMRQATQTKQKNTRFFP